MGGALI
jgi:hypothetical protein